MSAGDFKNNVLRLQQELKKIKFPESLDVVSIKNGDLKQCLQILHYTLLDYSRLLAAFIAEKGFELYGKTDQRFVEGVFRLMRDHFSFRPALAAKQFLSRQFIEHKIIFLTEAIKKCREKHAELYRKWKLKHSKVKTTSLNLSSLSMGKKDKENTPTVLNKTVSSLPGTAVERDELRKTYEESLKREKKLRLEELQFLQERKSSTASEQSMPYGPSGGFEGGKRRGRGQGSPTRRTEPSFPSSESDRRQAYTQSRSGNRQIFQEAWPARSCQENDGSSYTHAPSTKTRVWQGSAREEFEERGIRGSMGHEKQKTKLGVNPWSPQVEAPKRVHECFGFPYDESTYERSDSEGDAEHHWNEDVHVPHLTYVMEQRLREDESAATQGQRQLRVNQSQEQHPSSQDINGNREENFSVAPDVEERHAESLSERSAYAGAYSPFTAMANGGVSADRLPKDAQWSLKQEKLVETMNRMSEQIKEVSSSLSARLVLLENRMRLVEVRQQEQDNQIANAQKEQTDTRSQSMLDGFRRTNHAEKEQEIESDVKVYRRGRSEVSPIQEEPTLSSKMTDPEQGNVKSFVAFDGILKGVGDRDASFGHDLGFDSRVSSKQMSGQPSPREDGRRKGDIGINIETRNGIPPEWEKTVQFSPIGLNMDPSVPSLTHEPTERETDLEGDAFAEKDPAFEAKFDIESQQAVAEDSSSRQGQPVHPYRRYTDTYLAFQSGARKVDEAANREAKLPSSCMPSPVQQPDVAGVQSMSAGDFISSITEKFRRAREMLDAEDDDLF